MDVLQDIKVVRTVAHKIHFIPAKIQDIGRATNLENLGQSLPCTTLSRYIASIMAYLLEGILLGLALTIMLGPIFIALTQTSIERGARAGMTVGLGIWSSDLLIIGGCYYFIRQLAELETNASFKLWMGIGGGAVLVAFGIGAIAKKVSLIEEQASFKAKTWIGFWLKGFLVNTVNPFTFFFWITVITTNVLARGMDHTDKMIFLGGIMSTIIITDSGKVLLAKLIRKQLTAHHISMFGKVAGIGLIIFGLVLIVRVLL